MSADQTGGKMKQIFFDRVSVKLDATGAGYHCTLPEVTDISKQEGVRLYTELLEEGTAELEITIIPLSIARPEFFPAVKGSIFVAGVGAHILEIPFGQFDFPQMVRAFLNYVDGVSVRLKQGVPVRIEGMEADRMGDFSVRAAQNAKAGREGEWVGYLVFIENRSARRRYVNISQCKYGKECLPTEYKPNILLEAGECREYIIKVRITEDIPPGGFEKSCFLFVPDGEGIKEKRLVFTTAKHRGHPYLVLTGRQWEYRKRAILADGTLYRAFDKRYLQVAGEWKVPLPSQKEDFVYPSYVQNSLFADVVAWKITGEETYLKKAMDFFGGLLDEKKGYLATRKSYFEFVEKTEEYDRGDFKVCRAQDAGWVQEAEFFNRVAVCYDLLYEFFVREEHEKIEDCLRNYMEFVSWRLTDGDGNNFQIAESAAGLLCAMVLQDYSLVERFLYGYNGVFDLLSTVLLDDGMYFEEASGYVRLAGELFFDIANASENFGLSVKDVKIPASFDRKILRAPWAMREYLSEDKKPFLGMSFSRFDKFTSVTKCMKDFFDCTAKLLTVDGIMFSVNDSNEQDFTGLYGKAYYLYGDGEYKEIAARAKEPELLFVREQDFLKGLGKVGDGGVLCRREMQKGGNSLLLTGAGFGVLRDRECQAVLKFGVHGGYHGHFDRLSLASFFKEGKTFHNNEYAWYGYSSFLFKMWVQTSMAHNMVVVDGRMQKPSPCQCVYYEPEGRIPGNNHMFRAVCAQTSTEWIDPPYGGQTPYPLSFPQEKCRKEGRFILIPDKPRKQGEIGEYSEPVFQRRLLVLFHGYCIIWDYLAGGQVHRYDCLYHPMGRFDNEDGVLFAQKARFSDDPFGAGQFVTNCHTAQMGGVVCLRFHGASARVNPNDIMDFTPESAVWRVWPDFGEVTVARYPQRIDRFTEEEFIENMGFLQEPLKKTVSFSTQGRSAEFITILETGERTGRVKDVQCKSFSSLVVTEENGVRWKVMVDGMSDLFLPQDEGDLDGKIAKEKDILVSIRCEGGMD